MTVEHETAVEEHLAKIGAQHRRRRVPEARHTEEAKVENAID